MAMKVYVLIETQVGKTAAVVDSISTLTNVAVNAVTGPYDAIATVEGENLEEVGEFVSEWPNTIKDICRTVICVAVPA